MTKIVCISDTHTYHSSVKLPAGDILIHSGDFLGRGSLLELSLFLDWIQDLDYRLKIVVPGNHDCCVQERPAARKELGKAGVQLLVGEAFTDPGTGLVFYGHPWTPDFYPNIWSYQESNSDNPSWDVVPEDTDVLVSHGPPFGYSDAIEPGISDHLGSMAFLQRIKELKDSLKLIVCGHIHGGYGISEVEGVPLVNASVCTETYMPTNPPIVYELL